MEQLKKDLSTAQPIVRPTTGPTMDRIQKLRARKVPYDRAAKAAEDFRKSTREWVDHFARHYGVTNVSEQYALLVELRQMRRCVRLFCNTIKRRFRMPGTPEQKDEFLDWLDGAIDQRRECISESENDRESG